MDDAEQEPIPQPPIWLHPSNRLAMLAARDDALAAGEGVAGAAAAARDVALAQMVAWPRTMIAEAVTWATPEQGGPPPGRLRCSICSPPETFRPPKD